ncbi:MAG: sugar ABC transporter substrate-binding protein, partial [Paracoccus sp. (in: a-proteobacteria)]
MTLPRLLLATTLLTPGLAAADAMDDARALIETHRQIPVFEAMGAPFDARACMADKRIFSVPVTMNIPFMVALSDAMKRAADEVGFEFTLWENQGGSDAWIQGVNQAVSQNYDLVDVAGGLNPAVIAPQLMEARNAGLKVTTTHLYDDTQDQEAYVDASAKVPFSDVGRLLAAWAYVQTDGAPNVLIVGSDDVLPSIPFVQAIQDQLDEYCPDCQHQYLNVPLAEWATRITPGVQSALLSNPDINYI